MKLSDIIAKYKIPATFLLPVSKKCYREDCTADGVCEIVMNEKSYKFCEKHYLEGIRMVEVLQRLTTIPIKIIPEE